MHLACISLQKHPGFISKAEKCTRRSSPDAREPRSGLHLGIEGALPDEPAQGADIPVLSP